MLQTCVSWAGGQSTVRDRDPWNGADCDSAAGCRTGNPDLCSKVWGVDFVDPDQDQFWGHLQCYDPLAGKLACPVKRPATLFFQLQSYVMETGSLPMCMHLASVM